MKKNIIIIVLAVTTIASSGFAYLQTIEANKQQGLALQSVMLAKKMIDEAVAQQQLAEEQRVIAEQNAAEAMKQKALLEQQLKKKK
jgi:hypothetical protein